MKHIFRPSAERQFAKLDPQTKLMIVKKLSFFLSASNPLVFAKRLSHFGSGQYRYRIGNYRVVFDVTENTLVILAIGHRREVYK